MEYLNRINNALDYIEQNLTSEIKLEEIAKRAYCSVYYFQRMFLFMADVPLSEYIRRRRMTCAAVDLQQTNLKIIDLAYKYGYESADAFSRAFKKIHGLSPSMARKSVNELKAYPRISFQISIKGEVPLNYRIEEKEAFTIIGEKRGFTGADDSAMVVPSFWNECYNNGTVEQLKQLQKSEPKGVHGFIQVVSENEVYYTIGCVSDAEPEDVFEKQTVPKSTWAIFEGTGKINVAMADLWKRIMTEWFPSVNYEHAETMDIECFPYGDNKLDDDFKFQIWVPIKERKE